MRPYDLGQVSTWLNHPSRDATPLAGVCVDSRHLKRGELFFALPGAKIDGHTFLEEVAAKGAAAAVVNASYAGPSHGLKLLRVPDVLEALQTLASALLKTYRCKVVAVTGSMGKTTTKDLLTSILKQKFRVGSSPGNSNSQIGVPLALLNHTHGDEEILVIEMGMTHPGQIRKLTQIAPPDVAIITTTALVHACNFDNLNQIGLAKAEIFSHPQTQIGLLDEQIVNFEELKGQGTCLKRSFAVNSSTADYSLSVVGAHMHMRDPWGEGTLDLLPLQGEHNRHNFLGAAAIARELGMKWEEINASLCTLQLPERRLQFVEKLGALFV
jgi:UDP-N-acetylmuramoyl-tripeptide--D-alanyl-D-alanine ligase